MSWISKTLNSSVGKKLVTGASGLFLVLFLTGHLVGNLQIFAGTGIPGLFEGDQGKSFNLYAEFMTHAELIQIMRWMTYFSIILHAVWGIGLVFYNKKARSKGYAYSKPGESSSWNSRSMGVLGTLLLVFIVTHMYNFWWKVKVGDLPTVNVDGEIIHNLFQLTQDSFTNESWGIFLVIGYVLAMVVLGFHLNHGFASAFQTFGLNHKKYTPAIKKVGKLYSILVPTLFALMPIWLYITK